MSKQKLTYKKSGVDIDMADRFVESIKPLVQKTHNPLTRGLIGGFSGFYKMPKGYKRPVLVGSTDGVGTKLLLAKLIGQFDTVGIDLVAMCVNDLLTCGAKPLFFLDYYATPKLKLEPSLHLMQGIVKGCLLSESTLLGGETAELPGLYKKGDFDLAGFSLGVVDESKIITGKTIRSGQLIVGLHSSGLHSNGYSLARKCFTQKELKSTIGKLLLTPTIIYVKPLLKLIKKVKVHGIAHITGGGFQGNIPRIFPSKNLDAVIDSKSWEVPKIFKLIQKKSQLSKHEMFSTFNMGIGMTIIINKKDLNQTQAILSKAKMGYDVIGVIQKGKGQVRI